MTTASVLEALKQRTALLPGSARASSLMSKAGADALVAEARG